MKPHAPAFLIPKIQSDDFVVTFTDGDSYLIRDLDIQGYYEDSFEICVEFAKCLRTSKGLAQALVEGYLKTASHSDREVELEGASAVGDPGRDHSH